ncbi:hypothetical protein [Kineosporia babensis]|uniref:Uncharacterized protein n=1 Tax=Kineosporia babensis TaxID=499548 RepID=A0A9X1SWC8_9ACTN|nr:hypothetical protein [Kineosporia babensis]MCD5309403.1 hypothetical protein [Kineosporia babensis]
MSRPGTILSPGERPSQTPRRNSTTAGQRRVPGKRLKQTALAASFLTLPLLLSGCSTEWASMSPSITMDSADLAPVSSVSTPGPTPSTEPSPAPTEANPFAGGDLAGGSLRHQLPVGDHSLVINYWTGDADSATNVHLSAELKGADRKHAVKVTRFAATLKSAGTETALADDQGEFVLTPPYSYTSALAVPASTDATSRSLDVRFDLLVETAPGSGAFYRQTVLDTVALNAADTSAPRGAAQ